MKALQMVLFALALAVSGAVFGRASEPVLNLVDEPAVAASGKALSGENLRQVITKAAQEKKWIVTPATDGRLSASLSWRNKHTIVVEIACAANRYSVTYKSSVNMNYSVWNDQAVIHPYYNRHVNELRDAIRAALLRM
jgi:hypothetical protein